MMRSRAGGRPSFVCARPDLAVLGHIVLHDDPAQALGPGSARALVPFEDGEQEVCVLVGLLEAGGGARGLPAQARRAPAAPRPVLVDQPVEPVGVFAGELLERGAYCLGDQLQSGQVAHSGEHAGRVGVGPAALGDQAGMFYPLQG